MADPDVGPAPKRRKNGRRKGAVAEIEVSKLLAAWWNQYEPNARFKRTPLSGGWGDREVRGEFKVAGDICTTSAAWPFTVEVKRREGWTFRSLAAGRPVAVWAWWRQTLAAAAEENRIPLLWFRHNEQPWLVLAPEYVLVPIAVRYGITPDLVFGRLSPGVDDGDVRPVCVLADKLLSISPEAFLRRRKRSG